ncbi:ARM repeat-containing protein [Exidia glandulosa HHB12029]|uniref:ARM repeat-containing protein n=1 Tax=Exidia glandulosa HHB12029 TaxID=1314781 RepID=A0A165FJF4_EXIGL|nr:ARM repeat-containing protein [Exidia glandulosa HHB12029]KZV97866.1 ARM repeat-containing protein [Exidia glandulosa HHB12029]
MATWTPQPAGLQEILQTVHDSTNPDKKVQQSITLRLNQFQKVPDYTAYLAHIFSRMPDQGERLRSLAGYILKNNSKLILRAPPDVAQFVKESILVAFNDPTPMVRSSASHNIIAYLEILEPRNWPECLSMLVALLDSPDPERQEAAMYVFEKACMDYPRKFDIDINGSRPLDFMVPKFLALTEHPRANVRAHSLAALDQFVPIGSQSFYAHIDQFISMLFKRASDEDTTVRRNVCQGLVMLLASRPDKLMPEIHNVAEYMIYSTQDKNETLALEACEFWLTFAEDPDLTQYLGPLVPKVAPVLLQCMIFSEDELIWLDAEKEDNAAVPDRDQDIKPRHYGGKSHGLERAEDAEKGDARPPGGDDDDEEYDDDDEDYDDDDDMSTDWNLRKCAAAALDVLAVRFGGELLAVLLPVLKEKLWSANWLQRESGILALGAVAEGCIESIEPHLPVLVPYLVNMLNDPKPLLRCIACWTLGRYASWCTQTTTPQHIEQFFVPTMEGLLRMVLDNNKRVQEAGCSAFATLEEDAGASLIPYLEPILRNLVLAFEKYQQKNMLILYDAVGTLADAVGPALQNPMYIQILMPPIIARWEKLRADDHDLVPLLECLSSVTIAVGPGFIPYAGPVFDRCHGLISRSLVQFQQYESNKDSFEEPDKQFIVVALDLLSGLVQGMGADIARFLDSCQPPFMSLLPFCLKYPEPPVRQSAYALVGDMAVSCFDLLRPYIPQILPEVVNQLTPEPIFEMVSATNNAAWSVGEVALRYGPEFTPWVQPLIQRLVPILLNPKCPRSLHENAAVTIGRIGLVHADLVAPHLEVFAQNWCQALFEIKDNDEKDSAFRGFCSLVQRNPSGISKCFLWFCNAVVRWNTPSPELNEMFGSIFRGLKEMSGAGWDAQVSQFPAAIQERLRERYNV